MARQRDPCMYESQARSAHTHLTAMQPAARVTPHGSHSSTQTTKCNQSVWNACLATWSVTVPTLGCIHMSFARRSPSDSIRRHRLSDSIRRQIVGATFPRAAWSPILRRRRCCGHVRIGQLNQSKASAPWANYSQAARLQPGTLLYAQRCCGKSRSRSAASTTDGRIGFGLGGPFGPDSARCSLTSSSPCTMGAQPSAAIAIFKVTMFFERSLDFLFICFA